MMYFELPLVGTEISVQEALAIMQRRERWGLLIRKRDGSYGLVDYRDLIEEPEPSRLVNDRDSETILGPSDIPGLLEAADGERLRDAVLAKSHRFAFLEAAIEIGGESLARLFSVSENKAARFLGGTPGKRCNHPNKPAGTPTRQWYHYYPPETPALNGTCSFDGSPIT